MFPSMEHVGAPSTAVNSSSNKSLGFSGLAQGNSPVPGLQRTLRLLSQDNVEIGTMLPWSQRGTWQDRDHGS